VWADEAASKPAGRFDSISISLHWLTLLLVTGQFVAAWLIDRVPDQAAAILTLHRTLGVATWAVVVFRLAWRKTFARVPPLPKSMPIWQRRAAKANEHALYALLLLQPLTGLGDTLFHSFQQAHELGALALLILIGLHAAAGLFHAIRRDGVFQRMAP
jgi:cytochrome b561